MNGEVNKLNIIIEPDAREFISKKDRSKAITLTIARRPGCCCGGGQDVELPAVKLGINPEKVRTYPKTVVDGIDVYYSEQAATSFSTIRIKLEKLLFFKKLIANNKS